MRPERSRGNSPVWTAARCTGHGTRRPPALTAHGPLRRRPALASCRRHSRRQPAHHDTPGSRVQGAPCADPRKNKNPITQAVPGANVTAAARRHSPRDVLPHRPHDPPSNGTTGNAPRAARPRGRRWAAAQRGTCLTGPRHATSSDSTASPRPRASTPPAAAATFPQCNRRACASIATLQAGWEGFFNCFLLFRAATNLAPPPSAFTASSVCS